METDRFLLQIPFIHISDTALHSWRQDWLADTEASLTDTITNSGHPSHDALANRAIVRAHLRRWDVAIDDAEKASPCLLSHPLFLTLIDSKSINICPSVVGYISRSVALIGGGKKEEGCRVFDLAFTHCHPHDLDFLLLVKVCVPRAVKLGCPSATYFTQAVVLFMAGKQNDAVLRVGDLIATVHYKSVCCVVQVRG